MNTTTSTPTSSPTVEPFPTGGRPATGEPGRPGVLATVAGWVPRGRPLPHEQWVARHRWIVRLVWVQLVALAVFGWWRGFPAAHVLLDLLPAAAAAALATSGRLGATARSTLASAGLMLISVSLVHLSDGYIEAHFHFFVMIPVVAAYQRWLPFGLSIWLVLVHHGVMGALDPTSVFNHPAAQRHPWLWGGVHALAIAAACLGAIANWRLNERSRDAESALAAELAHQVDHDSLTGLSTRAVLLAGLSRALARTRGHGADQPPAVLVLDMDGFKDVNDSVGHHYGDLVLVEVGRRLRGCVRDGDVVSRFGGDEFAMLVQADGAERVARAVVTALTAPFELEGLTFDLEVSIGIATPSSAREDAATLVRNADTAMYQAKEQHLGWVRFDGRQHDASTTSRLGLLGELRRALERDEIVLHFQPQVDLATQTTVGVEALARWNHPERGLLLPGEFIDTLERTSMSRAFTTHVLRLALDQVATWKADGIRLPVAVNVSPQCLLDTGLPGRVAAELADRDLDPQLLSLEVTETTLMADPDTAIDTLRRLRDTGVRISLDDFGTGYSSMSYLRMLPIDELKIDRSFVGHLGDGAPRDQAMVHAVVDLAHCLDLPVVAEGVEDTATLDVLADLRCDVAQGYHLGRPMAAPAFDEWLRSRRTAVPAAEPADAVLDAVHDAVPVTPGAAVRATP